MMQAVLETVRRGSPRVHCICNTAAANDVANVLLAVGAKPILAQAEEEAAEVARACSAVSLNCGTPDESRFRAMRKAAEAARAAGRPVVLDPVGAGASAWRLARVSTLLRAAHPQVIHCNYSECRALLGERTAFSGVDSVAAGVEERAAAAQELSRQTGAAVLLSGPEDLAAHAGRLAKIAGGSRMMGLVTGSGCMLSALLGAFCAAEPDPFRAAVAASSFWKACAQEAWERSGQAGGGPGTLHACLFDAAWKIREWRETIEFF